MAETMYKNMQVVPEKFSQYTIERTTELNTLVNNGIAASDGIVAELIKFTFHYELIITYGYCNIRRLCI